MNDKKSFCLWCIIFPQHKRNCKHLKHSKCSIVHAMYCSHTNLVDIFHIKSFKRQSLGMKLIKKFECQKLSVSSFWISASVSLGHSAIFTSVMSWTVLFLADCVCCMRHVHLLPINSISFYICVVSMLNDRWAPVVCDKCVSANLTISTNRLTISN